MDQTTKQPTGDSAPPDACLTPSPPPKGAAKPFTVDRKGRFGFDF